MVDNRVVFELNASGDYLTREGSLRALTKFSSVIQVVAPMPKNTSVMASFLVYDSRNFNYSLFMIPTNLKGRDVSNNPLVANYNVWEVALDDIVLSNISKYRAGRIGVSFAFRERRPSKYALNYMGKFDVLKPLPIVSNEIGDYYVANEYNFTDSGIMWDYNDNAIWDGEKWYKDRNTVVLLNTRTVDLAVDPSLLSLIQEVPTQDIEQIVSEWGGAFVETLEMAGDVSDLKRDVVKTISKEDSESIAITLTRFYNDVEIEAVVKISDDLDNAISIENGLLLKVSVEGVEW